MRTRNIATLLTAACLAMLALPSVTAAPEPASWWFDADSDPHPDSPTVTTPAMYHPTPAPDASPGTLTVLSGLSVIVASNDAAAADLTMPGTDWAFICHPESFSIGFDLELGVLTAPSTFTPTSGLALSGVTSDDCSFLGPVILPPGPDFPVPTGSYLAVRITDVASPEDTEATVFITEDGGGFPIDEFSYTQLVSPPLEFMYPFFEASSIILVGAGLAVIGAAVVVRRARGPSRPR